MFRVNSEPYPDSLSFDLLIEYSDALNKDQVMLDTMFEEVFAAIREDNPTRILFISPRGRSSPGNLVDLSIPSRGGRYLMAEWHFSHRDQVKPTRRSCERPGLLLKKNYSG